MLDALLRIWVKTMLWLRYRIRVRGLETIAQRGRQGILFLPNHPALLDPIIVMAYLHRSFAPRALGDKDQIDRFFVRWLAKRIGVRPLPDVRTYGPAARQEVAATMEECIAGLKRGENLLLYPSGHVYRTRYEDLRGNSAVESILRQVPNVRVVLVRTRGLWGSSFSLAGGSVPNVARALQKGVGSLLKSFIFFAPRRDVTLDLFEPPDLPRDAGRNELNAYLEKLYNEDAPPNTYVPYTIWEPGGPRALPDPELGRVAGAASDVPETTRQLVTTFLRGLTGATTLRDEERLAQDLGLDSLAKAELILWLAKDFGFSGADVDALQTVGDVMLAAVGQAVVARPVELKTVPPKWFGHRTDRRVALPPGQTITAVFLQQARAGVGRAVVADQLAGVRTYRDLITAILVLKPVIERLPGERIGIMLPASVAANVVYLAALFARKVPVMVNWTTGARNVTHALEVTEVRHVLTAGSLVARLESQGTDLTGLKDRFALLEELTKRVSGTTKLWAWLRARCSWSALSHVQVPETAIVLLTSGSESLPKAVPLTHANLLANIGDVLKVFTVHDNDCLLGFLPPFHSFGITIGLLLPMLVGARAVYHANPTEAWVLARLIAAYKATLLCGTPTFLSGIVRAATGDALATLRLAVTGAEKCPERTYAALRQRCPNAVILEGYGVTECAPVVAVNREDDPRPGTIGKVLPSFEHVIVDPDTNRPSEPGAIGMLLVRGPCVFPGYLGTDAASPFIDFAGKRWYRTGDLVSADADGVLTFRGRLKRFVKLGGEMISLPAIEAVLERHYVTESDDAPVVAVEATPSEDHPEIVLFTIRDLDRQTVNQQIRAAGLSPLHNVSRVVRMEQIPVLGTGKTDYRALKAMLAKG